MITKPAIIVTSLGRTGTKFFAALFREVVPHCTSLHEPDVFTFLEYQGARERIRQTIRQTQESGFYNLFVRKAYGSGSLIEISDSRIRGEIGYGEALRKLLKQRRLFVDSRKGSVYAESNAGYYGLVDILQDAFQNHRAVYIVRDAREWVGSKMNWAQMYNKGAIRSIFAHTWPTAAEIEEDPYRSRWNSMSRFERICWAWVRLNEYALGTIEQNPNARVFRFEDIFESEERYQHLLELVNFTTDIPKIDPVPPGALDGWLDRKIHGSSGKFPAWPEWSSQQKTQFSGICGPLMEALGYDTG